MIDSSSRSRTAGLWMLMLLLVGARAAFSQDRGVDITGSVTDRDNTRVTGTVYSPEGEPMADVDIWVTNDDAPSERLRLKTRKTGNYLARSLYRIYTERNIEGIMLRLTFEKPGYRSVTATVPVRKNALGELNPILFPEGREMPAVEETGFCMKLAGQISDPGGKAVKGATVVVTSPDDEDLRVEATVAKDGSYEVLLWRAPADVLLETTAPGQPASSVRLTLPTPERADVVAVGRHDIVLGEEPSPGP